MFLDYSHQVENLGDLKNFVDELIANYGEDMPVRFGYDFGDYWRSTAAEKIGGAAEAHVEHSARMQRERVVDEDEDRDPDDEATQAIILLAG